MPKPEEVTPAAPAATVDLAALGKAIAEGLKEAKRDPELEARKARDRQRIREERGRQEANQRAIQDNCPHLREDNTSAVAWMRNSDDITRGVCQRCNALFTPEHPEYLRLIRIPTRAAGVIF
jgi:hypothetical protein